MKLSKRIYSGIILTTLITVLLTSIISIGLLYNNLSSEIKEQVKNEAIYISVLQNQSTNELEMTQIGNNGKNRITLIAQDGTVKYDNYSDFSDMENHLERPEVKDALKNGNGESTRRSTTFGKTTYYYAVKLNNNDIIRVACETSSMFGIVMKALPGILFSILILMVIAMAVAGFMTNTIVKPINKLNIDEPLKAKTYDELSPFIVRIDKQNKEMLEQISTIYENKREYDFITENMHDGLIIIDANENLISANKAAENIFDFEFSKKPQNYLTICRNTNYNHAVEKALTGKATDTTIEKSGRTFRISASPVEKYPADNKRGGKKYAVFMFIHDITEKEMAEKMRREFSANVSHELKTPLTSIMGCSEIMKAGIAKPEDTPRFLGQINSEAKRLLALIDDIIRLSSLDEGSNKIEMEDVDLNLICSDVKSELQSKAQEHNISITQMGETNIISGNARLLHEMIFNLCDNSIRYNNDGGKIEIITGLNDNNKPFITVKDNGIGIAQNEQERVFERFYRVDKSHSKETGGTGLGLSIVKHAALIHSANLKINSELGVGTEITIEF